LDQVWEVGSDCEQFSDLIDCGKLPLYVIGLLLIPFRPALFGVEIAPTVFLFFFLFTLQESPTYLQLHGKETEARDSIAFYHSKHEDLNKAFAVVKQDVQLQLKQLNMCQVWKQKSSRKAAFMSILVSVSVGTAALLHRVHQFL
jgi:hypothetical protein